MTKRLTKKRAKIIAEHFVPLLEANLPHTDGDLAGAYEQYTDAELQDAIDALYNSLLQAGVFTTGQRVRFSGLPILLRVTAIMRSKIPQGK